MSKEFKEKRSFDDILWNTFIVIMVIFLGYALLLPRIRHVVEKIQGRKSAAVAKAAPVKTIPDAGPAAPAAQPPDTTPVPAPSGGSEAKSLPPSTTTPSSPAPSSAEAPPASTAPHVTVNPPPGAAHVTPKPEPKTKSPHATKPTPASKPPVHAAPFQARYTVDAGSYEIRSNAQHLVSELPRKYGPHTTITPVKVHGKFFYRVRIVVATKAEANALSAQLLQKEKIHALVLPLR